MFYFLNYVSISGYEHAVIIAENCIRATYSYQINRFFSSKITALSIAEIISKNNSVFGRYNLYCTA